MAHVDQISRSGDRDQRGQQRPLQEARADQIQRKRGEHVQIFSSLVGDTYVAQIIRILP